MDTPNKTFSGGLTDPRARDRITANIRWLSCPACRRGKVLKLLPETKAENLIVHCKRCGQESVVNIPEVPVP